MLSLLTTGNLYLYQVSLNLINFSKLEKKKKKLFPMLLPWTIYLLSLTVMYVNPKSGSSHPNMSDLVFQALLLRGAEISGAPCVSILLTLACISSSLPLAGSNIRLCLFLIKAIVPRPTSNLNNFAEVFQFLIRDNVPHCLQFKLDCCQHGFVHSRSPTSNLVTYLDR
jgi:hypothetical protein